MRRAPLAAGLLLALAARAPAAPGSVSFDLEPRVEALSIALMLAEPAGLPARRETAPAYAAAAEAAFASRAGHPAVALVARRRAAGASTADLAHEALSGKGALPAALAAFARDARLPAFLAARAEDRRAFVAAARREARHSLSPADELAYMGVPFEGERRFVLAPLLPDAPGLEALGVRAGAPGEGATRFGFDAFERSPAASLGTAAAASWLRAPSEGLAAHLAAAVGLRLIARDLGERVYRNALARLASPRLPLLERTSERLKDFERGRAGAPSLRAFFPRLDAFAELRVEQASFAARAGGRAEALALLAEARAHSPSLATGRRAMFLYQDLGEEALAKAVSDEMLASAPRHAGVLLDQAAFAAKAGDRAAGLAFLARARGEAPGPDALRRVAELALELKDYAAAGEALDAQIAADPSSARARVERAIAASKAGDRDEARRRLEEAASRFPSADDRRRMSFVRLELKEPRAARELLDALILESPADAGLRVDRAAAAAAEGDRAAGLRFLEDALALSPDAATRRRVALLYQELGEDARGRALLNELAADALGSAKLKLDRAAQAARDGDRPAALTALAEARGLNPTLEERRLMASLHQGLGDYGPALALLDGLAAAAPKDAGLRIDLAGLALRAGDADAARRDLAAALALAPDAADRRRIALLRQDLGDRAAALELLEPLARERPEDASLLADLGLCLYLAGRPADAVAALRAAIRLDPASLPAILTLGSIYSAQKRFAEERALYAAAPEGGAPELRSALERSRRESRERR